MNDIEYAYSWNGFDYENQKFTIYDDILVMAKLQRPDAEKVWIGEIVYVHVDEVTWDAGINYDNFYGNLMESAGSELSDNEYMDLDNLLSEENESKISKILEDAVNKIRESRIRLNFFIVKNAKEVSLECSQHGGTE